MIHNMNPTHDGSRKGTGCGPEKVGRQSRSLRLRQSILPIRLRPDFSVVFEGCAGEAEHWPRRKQAWKRSLGAEILQTCCLRKFGEFFMII